MSGQSSGQTLWSSTPSSSSSARELSGGSEEGRTAASNHKREETHPLESSHTSAASDKHLRGSKLAPDELKVNRKQDEDVRDELENRRHRPKHSSGFLLQPKRPPDIRRSVSPGASEEKPRDRKGKGKAQNVDLIIPKPRIDPRNYTKLAVGSSPLAREVLSSTPPLNQDEYDGFSKGDTHQILPKVRNDSNITEGYVATSHRWPVANGNETRKGILSVLGYDTDPAQIVNLALNLSESRRRNVSTGTIIPTSLGSRRLSSLGNNASMPHQSLPSAGGSLRQYFEQQRHTSRNISPRSSRFRHRNSSSAHSPRRENTPQSLVSVKYDSALPEGFIFNPSDATLARAEKARINLDLFYEYRRLLSKLPAIPTSSRYKSTLARPGGKPSTESIQGSGRSYNPLQYVRNRKVRARERRILDAEADGWRELDNVKDWVDRVAAEREEGTPTADIHYPLPAFKVPQISSPFVDQSVEVGSMKPVERQTDKQRRPRLDWSFAPWDLLADAYWVQEDNNIRHIEDAAGDKIFGGKLDTNGTLSQISQEIVPSPFRRSRSSTRQNATPEKLPKLFGHSRHNSTERERSRYFSRDPKTSTPNGTNSRDKRSRWTRNPNRSRDSLSSNDSLDIGTHGYSRDSEYSFVRDHPESAVLEKQMREMVKLEAQSINLLQLEKMKDSHIYPDAQLDLEARKAPLSTGVNTPAEYHRIGNWQGLKEARSTFKTIRHSKSASLDRQHFQPKRRSFDDLERAIASATYTRPASSINRPTTPLRVSNFDITPNLEARSPETHAISKKDFEANAIEVNNASHPEETRSNTRNKMGMNRPSNSTSESLAVMAADASSPKPQHEEHMHRKKPKDLNDQESKFRGFLKGHRIAQLVGNEVHKVGDKLRKRDNSNSLSRVSSVQSGYATDESDAGTDLSALESSPDDPLSTARSKTQRGRRGQYEPLLDSQPTNHRRLPNFRSAFANKTNQRPSSSTDLANTDHITRQQLAQRARGRSTRFDQLAPPKIDVDRIWPSMPSPTDRSQGKGNNLSRDLSRRSSDSRSDNYIHDADRRLNDVLGERGTSGSGKQLASSVSSLEKRNARMNSSPDTKKRHRESVNDQNLTALPGTVTKGDLARVGALLLSSGVKANEISRRAQEIYTTPSAALQNLLEGVEVQFSQVSRSQEHMFTAQVLVNNIEANFQKLRNAEDHFVNTGVDNLHSRFQDLENRLTQKLTPAVRDFADEADAWSTQLTTTHTLNFKQLNDSIEVVLRRRRRRFRWIRRAAYVLLEWILLGIMWCVWLIVVMVRIVRCTIRAVTGSLRWLFWV